MSATETKAQRVERLKREVNPWAAYEVLERLASQGFDAIPPEWLNTYFRWWGIYTQGDGVGAVGGKGGEGRAVPYFMVRMRLPNGILDSRQARAVADLAERHARGVADITVRQNFQLHWVRAEDLPAVMRGLEAVGLSTLGACGDVTRNVTGCPVAGVAADEIADASPLVAAATAALAGNEDLYNLPRKFKISIAGCRRWCAHPEINDIGLTALRDPASGEVGYSLRVGGGLSTEPHLSRRLDVFLRPDEVLTTIRAVAEIFRESDVLRQNRDKARLKYLFLEHGWTPERFTEELAQRLGYRPAPAVAEVAPAGEDRDHVGVHRQQQPGLYYVGLSILRGRMSARELRTAADLADRHGAGRLRTTQMQNLLLLDVPGRSLAPLERELSGAGLEVGGSAFRRATVACTGSEFCKLALTETKEFARTLIKDLEARLPEFDAPLKLHVTGCPNSCGQHWIADIGIEGKKLKVDGQMVDAYYFCVGGGLGRGAGPARPVGYRVAATEVPAAIERLLRGYLAERRAGETFRDFCAARSEGELRTLLAGEELVGVARDLPSGRPPAAHDG
jgi:sulfite reductase (ferredoxin)